MGYLLVLLPLVALATGIDGLGVWPTAAGVPSVGEKWGPVITHVGTMTWSGKHHRYRYGENDLLQDEILANEIFQTKEEMYEYLQSKVTSDYGVLKIDPPTLDGIYLEVLSAKAILPKDIKLACHSYKVNHPFCHRLMQTSHKNKLIYSMVRRSDDGTVFPVVFFSHQACGKKSCFWITHISEVVVLNKNIA